MGKVFTDSEARADAGLLEHREPTDGCSRSEVCALARPDAKGGPARQRSRGEPCEACAELQAALQSLEAQNRELRVANEALVSSNEELRASNEELQRSRGEVLTVNEGLRRELHELGVANDDLVNLFANTDVAAIFLDRELRVARFTRAATELLALRPSDLARPLSEIAPRFPGVDLTADARSVVAGGAPVDLQIYLEEGRAWLVARVRPYRISDGSVAGAVLTFVDVTRSKRVEEELRLSEQRFRLALRNAPVSVTAQDLELRYLWAFNQRTFRPDEILGRFDSDIFPPAEAERVVAIKRRVLAENREHREQLWFERPGRRMFLDVCFEPIRDPSGRAIGVGSAVVELTPIKLAEEALGRRERELRLLLENVNAGVALLDRTGKFSLCNRQYLRMFHLPLDSGIDDLNAENWRAWEVFDEGGKRLEVREHPVSRAVLYGVSVRDEVVGVRAPGREETTWMLVSAAPLFDERGQIESIVCTFSDITERRRVERAIEESRAKLEAALASTTDAVFISDAEGRFVDFNEAFATFHRFSNKDACAKALVEQALPVEASLPDGTLVPADQWAVPRALRGETVANAEYGLRRRDTGEIWVGSFSFAPIRDGAGAIVGAIVVARDITEVRAAERAQRESGAMVRAILDAVKESVWLFTTDGVAILGNDTAFARIGGTAETLLGRRLDEVLSAELARDRLARVRQAATEGPVEFEDIRDGTCFEHRFYPVPSADGRVETVVTFSRDITLRRLGDRRVIELSRLYAVLSKVNESIVRARDPLALFHDVCRIIADDGGRPLVWIGLLRGRTLAPVVSSGSAVGYLDAIRIEIDGEFGDGPAGTCVREAHPIVCEDFHADPRTHPWRAAALKHGLRAAAFFPLRREGAVVGLLGIYDSVAGTFDSAQVDLLESLSADVSYALDKLAQEDALRASELELRGVDRRKNEFLAVLSHELRNPLTPVRNCLFILDRVAPDSEQAARARTVISRQVDQLTRLVDDLLDVTRISRGKIQIRRQRFDVTECVRRVVEDHRSVFSAAGLEVEAGADDRAMWLEGDPERIAQAVGNLLQNAAKFTLKGGRVTVTVEPHANGREVSIRVRDTGVGIEATVLARLFQPFTQAESTLDRSRGGLGLGLALVKGLVELHGGRVSARSDGVGQGAEFEIRLPLGRAASLHPPASSMHPSSARRVVIIEDNVDGAMSLREALELMGHSVEIAHSGPEGLEKARASAPDVILCDIGLPGMNGYEVAHAVRADPRLASVLLIALTGYALPEDLARAKNAGFDEHVAKPPAMDVLEALLSRANDARVRS